MGELPLTLHMAAGSQVLPIAAGLLAPDRLAGARRWILIWCTLQFAFDMLALLLARSNQMNLWIGLFDATLGGVLVLWALSLWQRRPLARLTLQLMIPLYAVATILLALVEGVGGFSTLAHPVYAMLALGAAIWTLATRSHDETKPLLRSDWFWMCIGLALYFGSTSTLSPLSAVLLGTHPELVVRALEVKSAVDIVAFTAMTIGVLCPLPRPLSGVSLSPASSA
jgi:hypothetical protein